MPGYTVTLTDDQAALLAEIWPDDVERRIQQRVLSLVDQAAQEKERRDVEAALEALRDGGSPVA